MLKSLLTSFIFCIGLTLASPAFGATEFTSIIDPDNAVGTDYTSLSAWEAGVQTDLTASTTKVFSHGGITGAIADTDTVTGVTSGATASVVHATSTQVLLETISGTFQPGEQVQVDASNHVTISNAGDSAIAVAECRSTGGTVDTTPVAINGWTTSATNYVKVIAHPDHRHQGVWESQRSDGNYIYILGETTGSMSTTLSINGSTNCVVDGLSVKKVKNQYSVGGGISVGGTSGSAQIKNSIIYMDIRGIYSAIGLGYNSSTASNLLFVFENNLVFYDISGTPNAHSGIYFNTQSNNGIVANNTVYGNTAGDGFYVGSFYSGGSPAIFANNLAVNNFRDFGGSNVNFSTFGNNLSSDATAPGANSLINVSLADLDFTSTISGSEDFHIGTDSVAKDAGVDLSTTFTTDIDGTARGGAFDIGADEVPVDFVSTICENTSAGGNCANLDYSTLATWEDKVESDLTADTTRVFSGSLTGTLAENATVNLCNGATDTNIDGVVVAHTASGQILIDGITGSTNPLITTSGYVWNDDACGGTTNYWTVSGTGDDLGASPRAVAMIDGAWTTADTTAVTINGWTTDYDNSIKIYTTDLARHQGVWNDSAYRIYGTPGITGQLINIVSEYVTIDGLQLHVGGTNNYTSAIEVESGSYYLTISNSILKSTNTGTNNNGVLLAQSLRGFKMYNSVIYDFGLAGTVGSYSPNTKEHIFYNVTVYNIGGNCFDGGYQTNLYINCIAQNCGGGAFSSEDPDSNYNIADDTSISGGNNKPSTTVTFVDEDNDDFHLSPTDTTAIDAGTDLSADANLAFSTDIDGQTRDVDGAGWDIGADEAPTKIYRSVGPAKTTTLATDSSHANTVTLSSGVATFSTALADNIGVGDVVLIDTAGTDQTIDSADTILFIHGRTDSTHYTLRTESGAIPSDIAINDTYSIYRAYTSLSLAEAGTPNASLTTLGFSFTGGNRDLVTNNEQWNLACYGDAVDTTSVTVDGWTTGENNYLKIYTPVDSDEVGVSQRHNGKWDDSKYQISISVFNAGINLLDADVRIDGLQIEGKTLNWSDHGLIRVRDESVKFNCYFSNNILRGDAIEDNYRYGIQIYQFDFNSNFYIFNNIIYDLSNEEGSAVYSIYITPLGKIASFYIYNNTFPGGDNVSIIDSGGSSNYIIKNNIYKNNIYWTVSGVFENNLYGVPDYVDAHNKNFHLSPTDTTAIDAGTDLSADANLAFSTDIDGHLRTSWDIGADEASIEFDPTVMQSGGDYSTLASWEAGVQTDLTANTTRVFSHGGITGAIADTDTVTGVTSGATANVVHATTDQILLETISGTFQSGEQVYVTQDVNYVTISDNGNPAIAVAKIDGAWTTADTSAVTIDGWTTGPNNYIKIYTTETARHNGKWDDGKYRISSPTLSTITVYVHYLEIMGLQVSNTRGMSNRLILQDSSVNEGKIVVAYNLLKGSDGSASLFMNNSHLYNNIVFNTSSSFLLYNTNINHYIYNNTFYNVENAVSGTTGTTILARNNIGVNCSNGCYTSTGGSSYSAESSNNISSNATAPGANSITNAVVKSTATDTLTAAAKGSENWVIFKDPANDDYRLHSEIEGEVQLNDAIDSATDLSTDFTTDIRGLSRTRQDYWDWDIGAFRATKESKVIVDTANTAWAPSTSYDTVGTVVTNGGNHYTLTTAGTSASSGGPTGTGTSITDGTAVWDYYEVHYTALGTAITGEAGATPTVTSDSDLTALDEQLTFECRASRNPDGTHSADTAYVNVTGFTTGEDDFVKITVPEDHRHEGVWDETKYRMDRLGDNIIISNNHVYLEYLQMKGTTTGWYIRNIKVDNPSDYIYIDSCLIINDTNNSNSGAWPGVAGIRIDGAYITERHGAITNNILIAKNYSSNGRGIYAYRFSGLYANNTIVGFGYGLAINWMNVGSYRGIFSNNLVVDSTTADFYADTGDGFSTASDYNFSSDATAPGANSITGQTAADLFVDSANDNYELKAGSVAIDAGTDLSASMEAVDIIGTKRTNGYYWDIGAFEWKNYVMMKGGVNMKGGVKVTD